MSEAVGPRDADRITAFLDAELPPSGPDAHIVFGTNQPIPAELVAKRYHAGLAPLIILTGGISRHSGVVESYDHRDLLLQLGVPEAAIRLEHMSTTTQANVEQALPFLHEALEFGLGLTAVCKWYHRRALHLLRASLPEVAGFHAVTWEPVHKNLAVTRSNWWCTSPAAAQRVIREWQVIPERLAAGLLVPVERINGAWR